MAKTYNLTMQLNLQGPANLKSVSSKIRKELSGVSGGLNLNIDKSSLANIDKATVKIKQLSIALSSAEKSAVSLNQSLSRLGGSLSTVKSNAAGVHKSYTQIDSATRKMTSNMNKAAQASKTLGASLLSRAKEVALVRVLSSVTSTLTSKLVEAGNAAVEFERTLIKIQQIGGAAANSFASLERLIRGLSKEFGVSSSEMAQVAVTFKQAGLSATELQSALRAVSTASLTPTFTSMRDATEGAIAALRQFRLEATQIQGAFDAMNSVAGQFAVEFDDLVSAIQRGGGAFAVASRGIDDGSEALNKFLAIFTTVRATTRESSETIATGIRTISARLQQLSTQKSIEEILGEDLNLTVNGQFIGVYQSIEKISTALKKAGISSRDARFSQIAEEIGGIRQISRVIPLLTDFKTAQEALNVAQNSSGSSAKSAAEAQKSLAVQLSKTYEAWQETISAFLNNAGIKTIIGFLLTGARLAAGFAKAFAPLAPLFAVLGAVKIGKGLLSPKGGESSGGGLFGGLFGGKKPGNEALINSQAKQIQATQENTAALKAVTNSGSRVSGFARGGVVPGTGRGDTVPAMLTPGEFVIRKDAVKAIGTEKLHKMNKYASGGEILEKDKIGVGTLEPGSGSGFASREKVIENASKTNVNHVSQVLAQSGKGGFDYKIEGLSEGLSKSTTEKIDNNLRLLVNKLMGDLDPELRDLGVSGNKIAKSRTQNFIGTISDGMRGAVFEALIDNIAKDGKYTKESAAGKNDPFDFSSGLGSAQPLFPSLTQPFVELKATRQAASVNNIAGKIASILSGVPLGGVEKISQTTEEKFSDALRANLKQPNVGLNVKNAQVKSALEIAFKEINQPYTEEAALGYFESLFNSGVLIKTSDQTKYKFPTGFAQGGSVSDTVPAMLTPGEFVINKRAAAKIGGARLEKLNKADKISGFNKGGAVGSIQRFADGGEALYSSLNMKQVAKEIGLLEREMKGMNKTSEDYKAALELQTELLRKAQQLKQDRFVGKKSAGKGEGFVATSGGPAVNPVQEAKNLAASMAYIRDQAEASGMSLAQFEKALKERSKAIYSAKKDEIKSTRSGLKSGILGALANRNQILGNEKNREAFKGNIANQLTSILGDIDPSKITDAIASVISGVEAGKSLEEIVKASPELESAFNDMADGTRAAAVATKALTDEFGQGAKELKLTAEEIGEIEWEKAGGRASLGGFGKLLDGLKAAGLRSGGAYEFSQGSGGKFVKGLQDSLSSEKLLGKIPGVGPKLAELSKGLGGLKSALGGIPGLAAAAGSALSGEFLPTIEQTGSAAEAALVGGTQGALQGAATAAAIGNAILPGIGGLIGAAVGGLVGGIKGAIQGFQTKRLEKSMQNLEKTMAALDVTFENYERVRSVEALDAIKAAARASVESLRDVQSQAAFGSRKTYLNYFLSTLTAGLVRFGRPTETNDKALQATISANTKTLENITKLANINASTKSVTELSRNIRQIRAGNINASTLVQTATKDFDMSPREFFRAEGLKLLSQQYGGDIDLVRKNFDPAEQEKIGKKSIETQGLILEQEAKNAALLRAVNIEIENILNKYTTFSAGVNRIITEQNNLLSQIDNISNIARGTGEALTFRNTTAQILENPRGFNDEEFNSAVTNIEKSLPDDIGKEVSDALKAQRVIDLDLPTILADSNRNNTDAVGEKLEELFRLQGVSDGARETLVNDVIKAIERQTGEGEATSLQSLADEVPALAAQLKGQAAQVKFASDVAQLWGNTLDSTTKILNQWSEALDRSRERTLKGDQARIEGQNQLAEVLGKRLSFEDRARSFRAEFDSLAPGTRRGNDFNLADIERRRDSRDANNKGTRLRIEELRKAIEERPAGSADTAGLQQQLEKVQEEDRKLVAALTLVADSNVSLDAAISSYQEQLARDEARLGYLERIITQGPVENAEMARDLSILNDILANGANANPLNLMPDSIAAAFRALESSAAIGALSPAELRKAKGQVFEAKLRSDPNLARIAGIQGNDERSIQDAVNNMLNNTDDPLLTAAQEAYRQREEANDILARMETGLAGEIATQLKAPLDLFVAKLKVIFAEEEARRQRNNLPTNSILPDAAPVELLTAMSGQGAAEIAVIEQELANAEQQKQQLEEQIASQAKALSRDGSVSEQDAIKLLKQNPRYAEPLQNADNIISDLTRKLEAAQAVQAEIQGKIDAANKVKEAQENGAGASPTSGAAYDLDIPSSNGLRDFTDNYLNQLLAEVGAKQGALAVGTPEYKSASEDADRISRILDQRDEERRAREAQVGSDVNLAGIFAGYTDANPLPVRVVSFGSLPTNILEGRRLDKDLGSGIQRKQQGTFIEQPTLRTGAALRPGLDEAMTGVIAPDSEKYGYPTPAKKSPTKGETSNTVIDASKIIQGITHLGTISDNLKNIHTKLESMNTGINAIVKMRDGLGELKFPLVLEPASAEVINKFSLSVTSFGNTFGEYIDQLNNITKALPKQVNVTYNANHNVKVEHIGTEIFQALEGQITEIVVKNVNAAFFTLSGGLAGRANTPRPLGQ